MTNKVLSVCLVTCYRVPNYVRVKSIEAALNSTNINLSIVRNRHVGFFRYVEVILSLIKMRFTVNPDVYVVTFRGYEILPAVLLIALGKKVIFDEFINLIEWSVYEHHKLKPGSLGERSIWTVYRFLLKRTALIITDTMSHARYSARLMRLPLERYRVLPVGTDESVFRLEKKIILPESFTVFYYGSMLPLHGVDYVIDAALRLKKQAITFKLVGGDSTVKRRIDEAVTNGARIEYKEWIPYDELSRAIQSAHLCLGGPFGDTVQSQFVITGKTQQFLKLGRPTIVGKNEESEIFRDKENGLVVEQADAISLAKAIRWAYEHQELLEDIGKSGAALYRQRFSKKAITQEVRQILGSL